MKNFLLFCHLLAITLLCSTFTFAQGTFTSIYGGGGWGAANSSGPAISSPSGNTFNIARDNKGNLYYGDYRFHIISKVDTSGNIHRFMGDPTDSMWDGDGGPATAAHFWCIEGLASDATGNVYFAEGCMTPTPIRMIDTSGIVNTIYVGSTNIYGLYSDAAGNLVFPEGNVVKVRTAGGTVTTVAGTGTAGYSGDGGAATAATLNYPWAATFDVAGNVYIADGNNVIRKVNTSTGIITTIAGNGSTTPSGDGGLAINAGIGTITSLRFDAYGNLHLNSNFAASRVINPAGIIHPAPYGDEWDIAFDPAGNIYSTDGTKFTPGATATVSSYYLYVNQTCGGPQITIASSVSDTTRMVATYYGDGHSDTVHFEPGSFGTSNYALSSHTYAAAGSYTIKSVIYNSGGLIDSFITSYMHLPCGVIHLQAYADLNSNCIYDTATEVSGGFPLTVEADSNGVPVDTISITGGTYYTAYGTAGDVYTFRVLSAPTGAIATCPSSGIISDTFTIYGDNSRTINIGFGCSSVSGFDLAISAAHRAGRHSQIFNVAVGNNYCTPTSGTLSITFSPKYNYHSATPSPTSVIGQTATWSLAALSTMTGSRNIQLSVEVPSTWLTPGDTALSTVVITPVSGDLDTSNNKIVIIDTIRSSFDPNFMSVTPEGNILAGSKLRYAVEFENDGNDTAINVYVLDTLPAGVNPSTLEMVSASKPMSISSYSWGANTIIKFDFPNIKLLDSSHHGQCTGTFTFNIKTRNGLSAGTTIMNRAGIYFDGNPVVMTNAVYDYITAPSISIVSLGTVCAGSAMSFVATSPGIANTGYKWQVNGASTGVTTDTFSSSSLSAGDVVRCLLWDTQADTFLVASSGITVSFTSAPSAGTLSGSGTVCTGGTTTLTPTVTGGAWSGSSSSVASVSGGVVTGVSVGSATITYTVTNSCGSAYTTHAISVNAGPSAGTLSGASSLCTGTSITLTPSISGGSWGSSATGVASVDGSGNVYGVASGSATISYSITNSCGTAAATQSVTVVTTPSTPTISGASSVCSGASTTLTGTASGGSWSSATTSVASVSTSGVVYGLSIGTSVISYSISNACGSAMATTTITVNTTPTLASITGPASVCPGATITLSEATTGGSWSSSATSTASIGAGSGIVTGMASGSATITYTLAGACGTAAAIYTVTVLSPASAGTISGATSVCPGSAVTLTDAVSGGTWGSSSVANATVSSGGTVTGITPGSTTISYSVTSTCGTAMVTYTLVVSSFPATGVITGAASVCEAATITLSDTVTGGAWSSSAPGVASVDAAGVVTGVTGGTANIIYVTTNSCGTASAAHAISVNPRPDAGTISGTDTVCMGSTVTLSETVTSGTWTSGNTAIAVVSAGGVVTGTGAGAATISYTKTNTCGPRSATYAVNVISGGPCPGDVNDVKAGQSTLQVYPNPNSGSFTVTIPGGVTNVTIRVTDVTGKIITELTPKNASGLKMPIELGNVAKGTYLLEVSIDGAFYHDKVIVW